MIKWYDILLTICTGGWWVFVVAYKANRVNEKIVESWNKMVDSIVSFYKSMLKKGAITLEEADAAIDKWQKSKKGIAR